MATVEVLRFSPEQQQAYRQIAGFFGRAERESPVAAKQLVNVVGGLVGEQRTTKEKLQDGMGNIDVGLALIGDWLKETGADGFEVKLGFGGGAKKAIGRSQINFPTVSDLIRIRGRVDPELQTQIPPLLSSFSRQIRGGLDVGLSPREIVGGLVAESVGSRPSANGSANLRQALNRPLGGHFEWIREALGIADAAGQPGFAEKRGLSVRIRGVTRTPGAIKEEAIEPEVEISSVVEVGSIKSGMIPTLLEGKVLERIHHYLSLDTRNEQGGLVVFNVEKDPVSKRNASRVVDFIPSRLGKKTGVSFQWVSDDFTEAHQYVDQNWPGSMLGFIHSHPGMSVGPTGESLDSFILKGYCKEPFIPFLIYNPISRTINDLRWDANRNQAVSVGGILIDQAGLSQENGLQFVNADFFGGQGKGYKATLVPSGKSLEESIEISGAIPTARAEKPAKVELADEERNFMLALENLVEMESQQTKPLDADELQTRFMGTRGIFSRLPSGSKVRAEVIRNVIGQLGEEGEKMRKARKSDEQIFEEWLKQVFIPLYRRIEKKY